MRSKNGGARFRSLTIAIFVSVAGSSTFGINTLAAATLPAAAATKQKIQASLDKSDRDSLVVFDHEGNQVHKVPLKPELLERSSSLFDYVKTSGTRYSAADPFAKDKPAQCEDPKPVPNLPLCVICKSGNHVCTKAKFSGLSQSSPQQ